MRSPLTELVAQIIAYILDFKRLQQMRPCRPLADVPASSKQAVKALFFK